MSKKISLTRTELKEISYKNLKEVEKIYDTLREKDKKGVLNIVSLAEAYINYNVAGQEKLL